MHGRILLQLCKKLPHVSDIKSLSTLPSHKNLSAPFANSIHFDAKLQTFHQSSTDHYLSLLKDCHGPLDLLKGRQIHAQILVNGAATNIVDTRVLGMYVLCRSFSDAKDLFFRVDRASPAPWKWMIQGFTNVGSFEFALLFYFKMFAAGTLPDNFTFASVIKSCNSLSAVKLGMMIHKTISLLGLEQDIYVGSALIKMYAERDHIDHARDLFDRMPERNSVVWNVMIHGYARIGERRNAIGIFNQMRVSETRPDSVSLCHMLSIAAAKGMIEYGNQLHGLAVRWGIDLDASVANTLLAMYSKCRCLSDVSKLFSLMPQNNLVAWNGMISGYVQNGLKQEALGLFYGMQDLGVRPDFVTFTSLLPSFSDASSAKQGKEIHAYIIRNGITMDAYLKSALIDIYFKSKDVDTARKVFESTKTVDVVISNAMISGFTLNGLNHDALKMFSKLLSLDLKPDAVTVASVLPACSSLTALRSGREFHGYILKNAFEDRCYVASALMDMYAKCGRLDISHEIFKNMPEKNEVAWNIIIAASGTHGYIDDAVNLFMQMEEAGFHPNHITFLALISACAHAGKVEEGIRLFRCMSESYGVVAEMEHYACMVDLFGRAGQLDEALDCIMSMPFEPAADIWGALLGACRVHGNMELAELASKHLFELDPSNSGYYVTMSNINAVAGRQEEVSRVRSLLNDRRVVTVPGYSWININNTNHVFLAADMNHPDCECIYMCLRSLYLEL